MSKRKKRIKIIWTGIAISLGVLYIILNHYNKLYDPEEVRQLKDFFSHRPTNKFRTNGQILGNYTTLPIFWDGVKYIKDENGYKKTRKILFFNRNSSYVLEGTLSLDKFNYLELITFGRNWIDSLIVKDCPKLEMIDGDHNNICFLQIDNCPNLKSLFLSGNPLETLDVTGCPNLEELYVKQCPLKELNVLEPQPWQTWELNSATVVVVIPKIRE